MGYGVSATGFLKKTLAIIQAEYEASYRASFGNSINLQPPSLMATTIGIAAEREAEIWDMAEELFNSRSPSSAQGVSLDNLGEITNEERIAASPSKTFLQIFFGDIGTVIPTNLIASVATNSLAQFSPVAPVTLVAGVNEVQKLSFASVPDAGTWTITINGLTTASLAYNANATAIQNAVRLLSGFDGMTVTGDYTVGFTFTYVDGATVGSAGAQPWPLLVGNSSVTHTAGAVAITASELTLGVAQAVAVMACRIDGPLVADAKALTTIITPITGLTATKNLDAATLGRLVETDSEYRLRRAEDLQKNSAATVEAIRIAMKAVPDVLEAIVYENTTLTTDGNGVPGKAIQVFVDGGTNADIAAALFGAIGAGIESYGTQSVSVTDSQGLAHTIKFSRPVDKPVYMVVTITKGTDYPTNGDALVLAAVLAYGAGLKIGDDVLVRPKVIPAIVDTVPGIIDITVQLDFTAVPVPTANLTLGANERATFASANISVISS